MKIILSGYMGSGKTAVGKALAAHIDLDFLDLDEEINRRERRSIPEIFRDSGEIYFRRIEAQVLKELLEQERGFVLSLGGGTPCYGKNLQEIQDTPHALMVYLKTDLHQLKKRLLKEKDQRPLIRDLNSPGALEDFIRKHLFERNFYYNQSDLIISTDEKSVNEVAREIEAGLN